MSNCKFQGYFLRLQLSSRLCNHNQGTAGLNRCFIHQIAHRRTIKRVSRHRKGNGSPHFISACQRSIQSWSRDFLWAARRHTISHKARTPIGFKSTQNPKKVSISTLWANQIKLGRNLTKTHSWVKPPTNASRWPKASRIWLNHRTGPFGRSPWWSALNLSRHQIAQLTSIFTSTSLLKNTKRQGKSKVKDPCWCRKWLKTQTMLGFSKRSPNNDI